MTQGMVIYDRLNMNINGNVLEVQGYYCDDFDNPDFNNEYLEFEWDDLIYE
ncbi:hypothetical protein [Oceanirhabdus sp. W0125-5]|uniref:hypothetical protein n=1 Tax=Oceanirhabdus sp. W0125-5 TaxID=2999116 RepID=UPI0022F329BB|nr:hypothetical protein [Oceanirhabdus sp. W0125-5]WBW99043.1 hypothetical protein OW730_09940 [Oceanirhabdus sp. W0125-5]